MRHSPDPPPPPPPPDETRCELCGFPLRLERHCKIICPNCGFTRDCSDP